MISWNIDRLSTSLVNPHTRQLSNIKVLQGYQIRQIIRELAQLYRHYEEWPYLCQPDTDVDINDITKKYGENPNAIVCVAYVGNEIVGAAMGMKFHGEHGIAIGWFVEPLTKEVFPERTFYLGDLLVKPAYRNEKIGSKLYEVMEVAIRESGLYDQIAIALVHREQPFFNYSMPESYYSIEKFWERKFNFSPIKNVRYHWVWNLVDRNEPYSHPMDFWVKKLSVK